METENVSTAASRFGLRSATELVGDKEPRLAPKPSPVATRASASGPSGGCDIYTMDTRNAFHKFYAAVLGLINYFYPERTITVTFRNPYHIKQRYVLKTVCDGLVGLRG